MAVALGQRRRRAATRWRRRSGRWRQAGLRAPASGSAIRATCRPGTPISSSRRLARSWASSASLRSRRIYALIAWRGFRIAPLGVDRLRLLPRHRAHAVPDRAGVGDGGRRRRRDPADRRRDAVSQLRRVGDGRELRGARASSRRFSADERPAADFALVRRAAALGERRARRGGAARWSRSRSTFRSSTPTTTSSGRSSVSRPTAAAATPTTRACWTSARQIPRGTVLDRRGLPLATDDRALLETRRADYQKLGVSLDAACPIRDGALLSARRPRLSSARRRDQRA